MFFRQIIDGCLGQYAYMIACQGTKEAIVFDPERDIDRYLKLADSKNFNIVAVAETHIHADFLSGARQLAEQTGAKLYLSAEGEDAGWGSNWAKNSNYDVTFLRHGDSFYVGKIKIEAIHTPGHTPEHLSFLVTDAGADVPVGLISGDFLFAGDVGRPDLLETAAKQKGTQLASAKALFRSTDKVFELPEFIQVWPGHGEGSSCGKGLGAIPQTTTGYEVRQNPALKFSREGETPFVSYILDDQPEPPLYFARMKALNRDGVPLLDRLPNPPELAVQELREVLKMDNLVILDTRPDRITFMVRHLPGALYTPLDAIFCTAVGSVVEDATAPILIIGSPYRKDDAVRRLVRIGYDNIVGFVTHEVLYRYMGPLARCGGIEIIDFAEMERMRKAGAQIIDVRYTAEFERGHVPGALHAPYSRLTEYLKDFSCEREIAVHCASGERSALAASYLKGRGFKVKLVNDNFSNYEKIGALETEEAAAAE